MNIAIWVIAGAALGWITFSSLGWNEGRNKFVAVVIGAAGGLLGGKVLSPMFSAATPTSDFTMVPLIFALVTAVVLIVAADQIEKRFGV